MTITVRLPKDLEAKLRTKLEADDARLSDFLRDAIAEKLEREPAAKPSAFELGRHLFGKYGSGHGSLAEDHEKLLREKLRAKHRR